MQVMMLWKVSSATGPVALYTSAGIPSIPGALLELVWRMAILTSSRVGGKSRLSIMGSALERRC